MYGWSSKTSKCFRMGQSVFYCSWIQHFITCRRKKLLFLLSKVTQRHFEEPQAGISSTLIVWFSLIWPHRSSLLVTVWFSCMCVVPWEGREPGFLETLRSSSDPLHPFQTKHKNLYFSPFVFIQLTVHLYLLFILFPHNKVKDFHSVESSNLNTPDTTC